MKRFIILALIALGCAVKQEVRYTRPWPTPEEIRLDLNIPETDPIEAFTFDSTLAFEILTSIEIAILDSTRLAYFEVIKDSFPDSKGSNLWASHMRSWIFHAYDSLATCQKRPEGYYGHLRFLEHDAMVNLLTTSLDSLAIFEATLGVLVFSHPHKTTLAEKFIPKPVSLQYQLR